MNAVARLRDVTQRYGRTVALDGITIDVPEGRLVGLIGPDGVGKSSLLTIVAGARRLQVGTVQVLDGNMADRRHRRAVCPRIAYMPQGLGKNLYPDLSIRENIEFFARLFSRSGAEGAARIVALLESTGLLPFADRPAGKLSGGMRQKLSLCCSLIHDPEFLILDEPTTGVDPLSRRQFWNLVAGIRGRRPGMTALVATAYMDEAAQFDWLIAMDKGRILAAGTPTELMRDTGTDSVEAAFIALLPNKVGTHRSSTAPPLLEHGAAPVIVASGLTRRFGAFTAVDHVSFAIECGEIFGFVGSNGCGKTTTMKMLTGLLPPSDGEVRCFGQKPDAADIEARRRVGYMSQAFSLYAELTVRQNLELHARLFNLSAREGAARVAELVNRFDLVEQLEQRAEALPLGVRQRLSLAVSIVHRPEILILDEPTSGVDPIARDRFWDLLLDLSRNQGVTIFVSTHFMNEAARCDRIALMDSGRVLVMDTPANLMASRGGATLEEAFISYLQEADPARSMTADLPLAEATPTMVAPTGFSLQRLFACATRETLELTRDRIRLGFAVLGTSFLMLVFGFGISTDVNSLSFAVLDHDNSHASRTYLEGVRGSTYFLEQPALVDYADLERRLSDGQIACAIEIPPGFGRNIAAGRPVSVGAWIDGARPFVAQTIRGYLEAVHLLYMSDPRVIGSHPAPTVPASVEVRLKYNETFDSVYAMVPSTMAMELALFPAILMALAVVREKELGSIINLYVTPLTRLEFLVGKQLPYIGLAMVNFALMFAMALFVFRVPFKGDIATLVIGTLVYVVSTTAYGMLISAFARTQIAALFGTAILTVLPATMFAGMLVPVSSLTGMARLMGRLFPMSYFLPISLGTFTKGLGLGDLATDLGVLTLFGPALVLVSLSLLRKQQV